MHAAPLRNFSQVTQEFFFLQFTRAAFHAGILERKGAVIHRWDSDLRIRTFSFGDCICESPGSKAFFKKTTPASLEPFMADTHEGFELLDFTMVYER